MMPEEWASMRSMARWVLPVLVGPSTAVTPWPRARGSRSPGELNEMGIPASAGARTGRRVTYTNYLYHNATNTDGTGRCLPRTRNESRTKRARIADSAVIGFVLTTSGERHSNFHQIVNTPACF